MLNIIIIDTIMLNIIIIDTIMLNIIIDIIILTNIITIDTIMLNIIIDTIMLNIIIDIIILTNIIIDMAGTILEKEISGNFQSFDFLHILNVFLFLGNYTHVIKDIRVKLMFILNIILKKEITL